MATVVFLHAHPDDESMLTGGVMTLAARAGHRVVLAVATGGEQGEVPDDLRQGETLAERRRAELACSASALGLSRVVHLGYVDSGMAGWPQNDAPESFAQADVERAAAQVADLLREEAADVFVTYDRNGGYGHPDHLQVHRVGHRAAELAATPVVYEATMNRDHLLALVRRARTEGFGVPRLDELTEDDAPGLPEAELTTAVDVREALAAKRASVTCHSSQRSDTSFFLSFPEEAFALAFGTEFFIRRGAPAGIAERELAGLAAPGG